MQPCPQEAPKRPRVHQEVPSLTSVSQACHKRVTSVPPACHKRATSMPQARHKRATSVSSVSLTHARTCSHMLTHAKRPTRGLFAAMLPRRPQEAPKRPPRGPQEAPKRPPRGPLGAPKTPQDAPRRPQDTPKMAPRRSKGPPGSRLARNRARWPVRGAAPLRYAHA